MDMPKHIAWVTSMHCHFKTFTKDPVTAAERAQKLSHDSVAASVSRQLAKLWMRRTH